MQEFILYPILHTVEQSMLLFAILIHISQIAFKENSLTENVQILNACIFWSASSIERNLLLRFFQCC